jgi:hypothetical protein
MEWELKVVGGMQTKANQKISIFPMELIEPPLKAHQGPTSHHPTPYKDRNS